MRYLLLLIALEFCTIFTNAQNYLITFTGTGASTTVSTVKVENLTANTTLTMNGSDILRLTGTTGINSVENKQSSELKIYPNPASQNSTVEITAPIAGDAILTILDLTGKLIYQSKNYLENGMQDFLLSGLNSGFYLINVKGISYQYSGKLLCNGKAEGTVTIEKISNRSIANEKSEKIEKTDYKGVPTTVDMSYNAGDRIKFTGISGIYSTVKTDIPTEDKTITFNFLACTDGDNITYPIVQIGNQVWMAENLKTTKYNDGKEIPNVTDNTAWSALTTGAYCVYNNIPSNSVTYGRLYNWYAIDNNTATKVASNGGKNVCPTGWHVPSDVEWTTHTTYLGGESVAGGKLKETGTTHWSTPNTGATNETVFTALPGGFRDNGGSYGDVGIMGVFWGSTETSTTTGWGRYVYYSNSSVNIANSHKATGQSVRCIKDNPKTEEAFPGVTGEYVDFLIGDDTITCKKIDEKYIFQGDIILSDKQIAILNGSKGAATLNLARRWPGGVIYYTIDSNLYWPQYVNLAIKEYEEKTNITFKMDTTMGDYVVFSNSHEGSYSTGLGMVTGKQKIMLDLDRGANVGTVIHEIGHTIGLIHEQCRSDRDNYIKVFRYRINSDYKAQFRKFPGSINTLNFDFESIMLYSSRNPDYMLPLFEEKPAMTLLDGETEFVGQREKLSQGDIEMIGNLYKVPTIYALRPYNIKFTTASVDAEIPQIGNSDLIEVGGYYGTSIFPEITGTKLQCGTNSLVFSINLTNLIPNKKYYVTVYATNNIGTGYGEVVSFKTPSNLIIFNPKLAYGSMNDIDNNLYKTIQIGTQTWMAQNLKTTKFNDGTNIPLKTDDVDWSNLKTSGYCYYKNDSVSYKDLYGALYNWYTVNTGKLCPSGWHVPSDTEWITLINYLITNGYNYDNTTSGNKIAKSLATDYNWYASTAIGAIGNIDYPEKINATGFTGLPGGIRTNTAFSSIGSSGVWWTATNYGTLYAKQYFLSNNINSLVGSFDNKEYGSSVRCIKDN
jgi:uncharacterized protein (TIGR02145 family)